MHVIFSHKSVPCNHEKDCPKNDTHISTFLIEITFPSHYTTHFMCSQVLFATLFFAKNLPLINTSIKNYKIKRWNITKSTDSLDNTTDKNNIAVGKLLTEKKKKTVCFCDMCLLIQYGFYTKQSPVSVNERKKCLVKSRKDSGAHRRPTPIVA